MAVSVPRHCAVVPVLILAGCFYGDRDLPPEMFARDEQGEVVVYLANCEDTPDVYDTIELNRLDELRGADGRLDGLEATTIWSASADESTGPVPLPERLPLFSAPPGMHENLKAPYPELEADATYRLVAFGPESIDGTTFNIDDLRQVNGQFDLLGRRFEDPAAMREYACSRTFAYAWGGD